jgi:hypothetical protein
MERERVVEQQFVPSELERWVISMERAESAVETEREEAANSGWMK